MGLYPSGLRNIREFLLPLVMRLTLRWWLVRMAILPFAQPPTFETLINLGSADMISFYQRARELAEGFSFIYGKDYHQKLIEAL